MNFPQIQIRTTDAELGLNIGKPTQIIRQPKADLQISQPAATLEMNTTQGKMLIDSSQARRDLGLIGPLEAGRQYAAKGNQVHLQGIARRAQEGNQLMRIENKSNPIPQIAQSNANPPPKKLGLKFVPSVDSVKLTYQKGSLNIDVQTNQPKIDTKVNAPIHEYTPGKVSGTMLQYPSIDIDVIR